MSLVMKSECEKCDAPLPLDAADARICSYECTFCATCVENELQNVCPNCGGGFVPRPIHPANAWREGAGLTHDPPDTRRRQLKYSLAEVAELSARLRDTSPAQR
jgi:uncharacterized protein